MNWLLYLRLGAWDTCMTQMEAAKSGRELVSILSERAFGIACDYSHCYGKDTGVPTTTFNPPALGTGRKNVRQVILRRLR